jgi:hypothetical protein
MLRGGRELASDNSMPRTYSFSAAALVASVTSWFEVMSVPSMSDITSAIDEGLSTDVVIVERKPVRPVYGYEPRAVSRKAAKET